MLIKYTTHIGQILRYERSLEGGCTRFDVSRGLPHLSREKIYMYSLRMLFNFFLAARLILVKSVCFWFCVFFQGDMIWE